jgi:hypothetical protein
MPLVITCDDFIKSGVLSVSDCCPYCHQDDYYLYEGMTIEAPEDINDYKAVCCCKSYNKIKDLGRQDWLGAIKINNDNRTS